MLQKLRNLVGVAVLEAFHQLLDVLRGRRLVESSVRLLLLDLVQVSSQGKLQNEVDPGEKGNEKFKKT